jgi:hypothetical protein
MRRGIGEDIRSFESRVYGSRWLAARVWSVTAKVWLQWDKHPLLQCSQMEREAPWSHSMQLEHPASN